MVSRTALRRIMIGRYTQRNFFEIFEKIDLEDCSNWFRTANVRTFGFKSIGAWQIQSDFSLIQNKIQKYFPVCVCCFSSFFLSSFPARKNLGGEQARENRIRKPLSTIESVLSVMVRRGFSAPWCRERDATVSRTAIRRRTMIGAAFSNPHGQASEREQTARIYHCHFWRLMSRNLLRHIPLCSEPTGSLQRNEPVSSFLCSEPT